jgi:hypothetical protein
MKAKVTLRSLAKMCSIDDFETPCEYDMSDLGVKVNTPKGFKDITNFVVKNAVDMHYMLPAGLKTTSVHKTLVCGEWIKSKDREDAVKINERMQVVDISVPDGECYLAGNEINHNTTPGGELLASLARV